VGARSQRLDRRLILTHPELLRRPSRSWTRRTTSTKALQRRSREIQRRRVVEHPAHSPKGSSRSHSTSEPSRGPSANDLATTPILMRMGTSVRPLSAGLSDRAAASDDGKTTVRCVLTLDGRQQHYECQQPNHHLQGPFGRPRRSSGNSLATDTIGSGIIPPGEIE